MLSSGKKIISIVLTLLLLCSTVLMVTSMSAMAASNESQRVGEVTELRESNSKTYQLSNGEYEWVGYQEDIHYLDQNGKYQEIDNRIVADNTKVNDVNYAYKNAANSYSVRYADNAANAYLVNMEYQGNSVSFGLADAKASNAMKTEKVDSNILSELVADPQASIVYKDAYLGIDLMYESKAYGIKEYIILNQPTDKNEFTFNVRTIGLSIKDEDGGLVFVDKEGKAVFNVGQLYAVDNKGVQTKDVKCAVAENNGVYQLKITVDKSFLSDANRAFPIVIDPNLMITGASNTFDTFVSSRYPDTNYYTNVYLRTGRDADYYARRILINFTLPNWIPYDDITSSYLRLEKYSGVNPTIGACLATNSWNSSTVTWNTQPNSNYGSPYAYNDSGNWWRMDVTYGVKEWLNPNSPIMNFGFLIFDATESGTTHWTTFYSSDAASPHKPELHIVYNEDQFLSYAYPNSTVDIYPYSFNTTWQTAMDQALNNWNNSSAGVTFIKSSSSQNYIYVDDYSWDPYIYGMNNPIGLFPPTILAFSIQLDSGEITSRATNLSNFITSCFVHELGHSIWLKDNPNTTSSSIMKGSRVRDTMTNPSAYDVANVDSKY